MIAQTDKASGAQDVELLTAKHLVKMGLYPSEGAVYLARARGQVPNFVRIGAKILFDKQDVLDFIQKNKQAGRKSSPTVSTDEASHATA